MAKGSSPEWVYVKELALMGGARVPDSDVTQLQLDRVYWLCTNHGLLAALALDLEARELEQIFPHDVRRVLKENRLASRRFIASYEHEAIAIHAALDSRAIPHVFTKGILLNRTLYGSWGVRKYNDIDLFVPPEFRSEVAATLKASGYLPGSFSHSDQSIKENSRRVEMIYRLNPDHLPHHVRLSPDTPFGHYLVDVAFDIAWYGSSISFDNARMVERATYTPVGRGELPGLRDEDAIVHICMHLFREAWFESSVAKKDVRVTQFADVLLSWSKLSPPERKSVTEVMRQAGAIDILTWVAYYTDALFGSSMLEELDGANGDTSASWLRSVRSPKGFLRWSGHMDQRIMNRDIGVLEPGPDPLNGVR